jgi:hypothetical protein
MAGPVWTLSVDLQAKTAVFQSGLADAAKSARGAFADIKSGGKEMGGEMSFSMMEARHSVMLLGEDVGIKMPRALAGFVAGLGPVGPALEAAFPLLAIIALAVLFVEHLNKMKESAEKLTQSHLGFEHAAAHAFDTLEGKLRAAEEKTDELNKDHMAALHLKIKDIDAATLTNIEGAFRELDTSVKKVLEDSKAAWYTFQIGAGEAGKAWNEFQEKFQTARDSNDIGGMHKATEDFKKDVTDRIAALAGLHDAESKRSIFDAIKQGGPDASAAVASVLTHLGVMRSTTGGIITQWKDLLHAVNEVNRDMAVAEKTGGIEKKNAKTEADNSTAEDAKKQADALRKGKEDVARIIAEQYKQEVSDTQAGEREVIEATKQGTQARLNAIDAAIMEEEALGIQSTNFYRGLWIERVQVTRQMAEEQARVQTALAQEAATHSEKMAQLQLSQDKTFFQLMRQTRHVNAEEQLQQDTMLANEEFSIQMKALAQQKAALDSNGKDYQVKLKQIQNREAEQKQEHENQLTNIQDKAAAERAAHLKSGLDQERAMFAQGFASVLMGHQSFAQMMGSIGDQMTSKILQQAMADAMANDYGKEKGAAKAARDMFIAGTKFPFPANIVMAPVLGAAAFAAMMAYAGGTDSVPGDPRAGDVVNARLTPGEGVVPGGVMDGLRNVARSGGFSQKPSIHVHASFSPTVHALDAGGVDEVLKKHGDKFQRHFEQTLRRMNK